MNKLLELRKKMKAKKPTFLRQDFQRKKLKTKWRQPKGIHSKLRTKFKGHVKHPSMGFSSPRLVRFLHPSGFKEILVSNPSQLKNIKPDEGIIIASAVGMRKKLELLKKIKELKLRLLNIKNLDEAITKIEDLMKRKKQEKIKAKEQKKPEVKKEKKTKEQKPETEKQNQQQEAVAQFEKRKLAEKREKEEKRKVLEAGQ